MQVAALQHVQMRWQEDGDPSGRPLVFANSLGTDLRLWDKIIPRLPAGLRVIRFDKRGHGLSSCPNAPYTMDDLAGDTIELMDMLDIKGAAFVGLSIGGMIGQAIAAKRPDLIAALVLSNTAARMGDAAMWQGRIDAIEKGGIESMADAVMERWFGPAFRQTTELAAWRNMLTRTPQQGYVGCCHAIAAADLSASTAALRLPVMGIAGAVDGSSPPEVVKATTDMVPGSSFHVIGGAGHLPCVEAPEEYANLLASFLRDTANV
ncbi:MAG: 3-oxoadipate enol-lactonase [Pseudomonadota bacterium]